MLEAPSEGRPTRPGRRFEIERRGGHGCRARRAPRVAADAPLLFRALVHEGDAGATSFDLSRLVAADGASIAILVALRDDLHERGHDVALTSTNPRIRELLEIHGADKPKAPSVVAPPDGLVVALGRATARAGTELRHAVEFVGAVAAAVPRSFGRAGANWRAVPRLVEASGANAIPIVLLLNFLLGFVTAYQAVEQFRNYGANIYVADLVGLGVTRELGPLMTAVILAGRSGAGIAAELATMRVEGELDGLRTIGLGPIPYLVFPRVLALILVAPILTMIGDVVGVFGGVVMANMSLDVTPTGFYHELRTTLHAWDVESGILKSFAFALAVGVIGSQQGFAAREGAESVGRRTTSTVVFSLVAIVLIDALFTVVYRSLGR